MRALLRWQCFSQSSGRALNDNDYCNVHPPPTAASMEFAVLTFELARSEADAHEKVIEI